MSLKKNEYYELNQIEENKEIKFKIKEKRKDAFIFIGKTGTGKTSLINLICGSKNIVGDSLLPETKKILKEKGNYPHSNKAFYCLDTPGLEDKELSNKKIDEMIKNYLKEDKYIKIKGIFFLINFHDNKLDNSFYNSLDTIINIFPMKNFWKHIILCFTHTFSDGFFSLEESKNNKQTNIKNQFKDIIEDYYKKKNINKINLETINFLFINTCSGKNFEEIKNNANFGQIVKNNNDYKDKVIKLIENFEKEEPMYYSITKEKKNDLSFEKIGKTYIIYEINYVDIIYKDLNENQIISQISDLIKKEKYRFNESFLYKHKRALGFLGGGCSIGIFAAGLCIPGVNVVEIGWLASLITGVIIEGTTGIFVLRKGMKNTLEKIKDGEIKSIEEFENK